MRTVRVFIERGKDGTFSAYMPDENNLTYGVIGGGKTAAEAMADFKTSYEDIKASYQRRGKSFEEVDFAVSFDIPSFLVYYADLISYKGLARLTGIAPAQLSQYISGYRSPSPKTTAKIQAALNAFGSELSHLQLV